MRLTTSAFADMAPIPAPYAFGRVDPTSHVALSDNRNPGFQWSDAPPGTRSFVLICHDPDVPSRGDDVNQEGKTVPASLPRVDFFHWVLIDIPAATSSIAEGSHSAASRRAARAARRRMAVRATASTTTPAGSPATRRWPATTTATTGRARRGTMPSCTATSSRSTRWTSPRLEVPARFTGADVRKAMEGHVLAQAAVTGRYTLNPSVRL